ncbi:MAG: hypothetical protein IKL82_04265 [Clostridia bacterium]|nr:hypothetical protein [Clostridia bacterium]
MDLAIILIVAIIAIICGIKYEAKKNLYKEAFIEALEEYEGKPRYDENAPEENECPCCFHEIKEGDKECSYCGHVLDEEKGGNL